MSLYNVSGTALTAAYDVSGQPLSHAYDVDGAVKTITDFYDETVVTNVYTSSISSQPQGGCIDNDGNVYICLYSAGKFLKYNISTGTLTQYSFTPNAYGHANGMAYNPNTDHIYIASMKDTGEVYELNKSCELVDTLYAKDENGDVFNCWNIAYDQTNERFITLANRKVFFMDNSFDYVSHGSYVPSELWPYTAQDIETDGEFIYCVGYNPNHITVADFGGNFIKNITNTAFTGEPESLCYDWTNDKYYLEGKSSYVVIREAVFKS